MQELEIEDVDFHERFPKVEPGFPNLLVAIFFCIKTVYFSIIAILRYFVFGPLCKQWGFLYHLSVYTVIYANIVKTTVGHGSQRKTS